MRSENLAQFGSDNSEAQRLQELQARARGRFRVRPERVEEDENFPGSAIVVGHYSDGRKAAFAIRRAPSGKLEGNEITYKPNSAEILGTQQLHQDDFETPDMKPIIEAALESLDRKK